MARSTRRYPRTARINELIREVVAEAIDRIDDDRLVHVAITDVDCDAELTVAQCYFDTLDASDEADAEAVEALAEHAGSLRKVVSRQTSLKRAPELRFSPDPAVRAASRIDSILDNIEPTPEVEYDPSVYKDAPGVEPAEVAAAPAPAPAPAATSGTGETAEAVAGGAAAPAAESTAAAEAPATPEAGDGFELSAASEESDGSAE